MWSTAMNPRAPEGNYLPTGFDLRGQGDDEVLDRVVHVHEVHHGALNDATAWGAALHLLARMPGQSASFARMLNLCRRTHESFATIASMLLLERVHPDVRLRLAETYPDYHRLLVASEPLIGSAEGQNRRYLLATQCARVCMQTPILREIAAERAQVAHPRARDTPDGRWSILLRNVQFAREAQIAADRALLNIFFFD